MIVSLKQVFTKNLDMLAKEISADSNEEKLWIIEGEVNNSAGTLCLHLCGNLQHFIGATLGNSGYVRDRKREFSERLSRAELLAKIERVKTVIDQVLTTVTQEQLKETYPIEVFGHPMTVEYFLIHLQGHLNYHLGQISYHRRLLDR